MSDTIKIRFVLSPTKELFLNCPIIPVKGDILYIYSDKYKVINIEYEIIYPESDHKKRLQAIVYLDEQK